ncbi:MAG: fibronectin type III domain-containing protein [Bdellovibrionaceae bacterium]|nr:fibronectin type III domain-containing protein [Bdellovibrio sp.]
MKFTSMAFVLILALSFSVKSFAEAPPTCTGQSTEECTVTNGNAHPGLQGEANSHHSKLSERMNSLFPEKQKSVEQVARPGTVKIVSPKFLAEIKAPNVKLEWSAAENATSYVLQVATDPNFKWLVTNEKFVTGNSFEVSNLEAGHKYYWRVAGFKVENNSSYNQSLFVSSAFTTETK